MATFRKRPGPGGRAAWQAQIIRRGHEHQYKTFDTKAEAEAWARAIEGEMDRGVFVSRVEAESTTLAELLVRYQEEITPQKRGAAMERSHLKVIGQDPIARCFVARITGRELTAYKNRRLAVVAGSTLNRELNVLSHVFTVAVQEWHIHLPWGNPVRLLSRPRVDDKRDRRLVGDELPRLLAAAQAYGGEIGPLITWAIETAMRRGEIAAMRWEHLDRKARVLLIPETKTGTPRRVPLSTAALAVLDGLPRRMGHAAHNVDGRVFAMHTGSISRAFAEVCKAAGIEGLTFHDLRHEATSRLFEKGLGLMEVASITGHKTVQMLKRYTHLRAEDLVGRLG
ncbi:site-specific integrase [Acidiferrobacter thiooxydans]|uniref:site-specific integrase n=1 Tax=Acidiferrobacter thiooxydans TaxID=163359 RepID=UPI0008271CBE|nr:site-specific integrase [Acidiferrobacter thiooxydans]UEO01094.1 site-specific integrase [Acidiferrobacter thiooxydans]